MVDNQQAVCLIADVIDSRINKKERELKNVIQKMNEIFKDQLILPFYVRAGDEIFGIVHNYSIGYDVFKKLYTLSKRFEIPFYVGIGFGEIFYESSKDREEINGPAIWRAADALQMVKTGGEIPYIQKRRSFQMIQRLDDQFKFFFLLENNYEDSFMMNYYVYFILERVQKRTPRQRNAIHLVETYPSLTYEEIGKKLGYDGKNTRIYVSNLLSRGEYQLIKEAERELKAYLYRKAKQ